MPWAYGMSTKHDFAADYGWKPDLCFEDFHRMYSRSSLAAAGVDKTIAKTWEEMPALWESEKPKESADEKAIAEHFAKRKIWRSLMDADRRSMVGAYAGAIILLRDGQKLGQPVSRVTGGLNGLAGIIPAWEGQLSVASYDEDETSDTYGEPLLFHFSQQAVGDPSTVKLIATSIHRDRVLIFSDDGTLNCSSALEPGYDDLSDAMKIKGAGGEGFWKSARGAPVIEAPQGITMEDVMRGMAASSADEVLEKLNDKVDQFQAGFDKALMIGGFTAKPLTITLPQPKEFWEPCVQSFAASLSIPYKELIGNVTGERASTEDAAGWARTNMSRRKNRIIPILQEFIDRLVGWGVLPSKPWVIGWTSLLEASPDDKLARAEKMANINSQQGNELVFLPDEIRDEAGFKSGEEVEGFAEWQRERAAQRQQQAEDGPTQNIPKDDPEALANAKVMPLYVYRKLLNADDLIAWAKEQGFKSTLPADDMHVTVLYSKAEVDPIKMGSAWSDNEKGEIAVKPGGPRAVEKLGENAVVLLFASDDISWRHKSMVDAGASHDFEDFQPHVTITYDPGDVDLESVKPFTGALRFGPELFQPINPTWKSKITEE